MTGSPITVASGSATDAGLRRAVNEDSHIAAPPVFLVADGMGGHGAGEIASAAVIDEFARLAGRPSVDSEQLHAVVARARQRVEALPPGAGAGAGTTLSGVAIADVDGEGYWLTVNLGDSRTYRISEGEFEQVSVDHSVVQELVDRGELAAQDAAGDRRRNVITRAIGAGADSEPDYWLLPAEPGDRILVCSDGLSGELDADRIEAVLRTEHDPQEAATRLVREALLYGGRDNITVVVVDALSVRSRAESGWPHSTLPTAAHADEIDEDTAPRSERIGGRR
ncbi:MAG: protein phosphatase 2C domain-containing protein [Microbacterium sp.]|uniref:PP2C family protein-serine/threonine phosphatase n=1 Tax=Microbacterium sp. TaxID=51671 RepID=UPI0039E52526